VSIHKHVGKESPFKQNIQELKEKGLTIVSPVFKPLVGQLVVSETTDLNLFTRSRPIATTIGRVATLHRDADMRHTGLDIAVHKVLNTGEFLGLRLGTQDREHNEPNIQALELASRYAFSSGRHGQDALGLAVLEGQIDVGLEDGEQQLLEPGSVAFIQQSTGSSHFVVAEPRNHATALLFAGSGVIPLPATPAN
jgi:hypothetical protein